MDSIFFPLFMVLYLGGMAFFTYYCIIADPAESLIAYSLTVQIPAAVRNRASKWLGKRVVQKLGQMADYSLVGIYLTVVVGSWAIIFMEVYPWIDASPRHVGSYHKALGYLVCAACFLSWRLASGTSPGIITSKTLSKYDHFPYDEIIFPSGRICPTVGIPKLARSKFDRVSGQHIARFDHNCGWLHQAIGEENYRWFLLFVLVHVLMCGYGTIVLSLLFRGEIQDKQLWEVTYYNTITGKEFSADYYVVFQYLFHRFLLPSGVLLLLAVMALTLVGFLGWHIWIASRGITTNEASKWDQVRKWHRKQVQRYRQAVKDGLIAEDGTPLVTTKGKQKPPGLNVAGANPENQNVNENDAENEVLRDVNNLPVDPGPMPKNRYDQGFVENWKEIIFPRSLRKEALERYRQSLQILPEDTPLPSSTAGHTTKVSETAKPKAS